MFFVCTCITFYKWEVGFSTKYIEERASRGCRRTLEVMFQYSLIETVLKRVALELVNLFHSCFSVSVQNVH